MHASGSEWRKRRCRRVYRSGRSRASIRLRTGFHFVKVAMNNLDFHFVDVYIDFVEQRRGRMNPTGRPIPDWLAALEEEDWQFLRRFVLASGSLKDLAAEYGVSYPTIRARLD